MAVRKPSRLLLLLAAASLSVFASAQRHGYSYALITKDGNSIMSNWSFNSGDPRFEKGGQERLYVKRSGKMYVITDSSTIAQLKKAVEPMQKIGLRQSAIGDKQSQIGEVQSRIGEKQSKLGEQMGKLGEQTGQLSEKYAHSNNDDEYEAKQQEIQSKMDALQRQMDALQREMEKPSKQQEELGRQQEALGRLQEKAGRQAEPKIQKIIDAAFAKGLASPA